MAQLTFTQQASTVNFPSPGRGAEQWHGDYTVDLSPFQKLDKYYRFQWYQFETSKRVYNFIDFDAQIQEAIDRGGKFGFGVMTCFEGVDAGRRVDYSDGSYSSYPAYLHNEMQASTQKDIKVGQCWVPNVNNESYQSGLLALYQAINSHLDTTYKGVKLRDAISYIDVRGFGNYGEWHTSGIEGGPVATAASLKRIVDSHIQAFPNIQLVAMIAALDGGSTGWGVFPTTADISYYLLTAKNNVGEIGWRRDSLGSTEGYLSQILENNTITYNGIALKTLIMNKWQKAPVVGEPNFGIQMTDLPREVALYHMQSFGNGNYGVALSSASTTAIKNAALAAGYRLTITSGNTSVNGSNLSITLNWQNKGIAPTYENWDVVFELKNTTSTVWSGKSTFKPRLFLPQATAIAVVDNFVLPSSINGSYVLSVKIVDPTGYRKPLSLAITNQGADGSYSLGSITVATQTVPNNPPKSNAGSDLTFSLPTNYAILSGLGTDVDGTVISYQWSKITGPTSAFLSPTNQAITDVLLSTEGDYVFELKATDDKGATSTDQVKITLNPAPVIIKEVEKIVEKIVEKQIQSITITYTDQTTKTIQNV